MRIRRVTGYFNSFDWVGRHYQPRLPLLDFYINRAGTNLSDSDRVALEQAKTALRKRFGRTDS